MRTASHCISPNGIPPPGTIYGNRRMCTLGIKQRVVCRGSLFFAHTLDLLAEALLHYLAADLAALLIKRALRDSTGCKILL
ncbi:hypothetical protein NDU88_004611 [Pleurodeles waltl]|uniref:Uncharacterized protein n=1 Tax=Pleurodeles waltl TaxID=8319 RepID=A0AAV7LM86_PLEWA|nr:hypothetical protein NDU88_004611 [Pleurodeles waltl]